MQSQKEIALPSKQYTLMSYMSLIINIYITTPLEPRIERYYSTYNS